MGKGETGSRVGLCAFLRVCRLTPLWACVGGQGGPCPSNHTAHSTPAAVLRLYHVCMFRLGRAARTFSAALVALPCAARHNSSILVAYHRHTHTHAHTHTHTPTHYPPPPKTLQFPSPIPIPIPIPLFDFYLPAPAQQARNDRTIITCTCTARPSSCDLYHQLCTITAAPPATNHRR